MSKRAFSEEGACFQVSAGALCGPCAVSFLQSSCVRLRRHLADQLCRGPAQESSAKRHANTPGPAVFYRVLCPAQRIGNVIGKVRLHRLITCLAGNSLILSPSADPRVVPGR